MHVRLDLKIFLNFLQRKSSCRVEDRTGATRLSDLNCKLRRRIQGESRCLVRKKVMQQSHISQPSICSREVKKIEQDCSRTDDKQSDSAIRASSCIYRALGTLECSENIAFCTHFFHDGSLFS
jgi:hypothetical protein